MDELAARREPTAGPSPDVIAKLKAQNPGVELHQIEVEDGEQVVICKMPSRAEYKRFVHMLSDRAQQSRALETLLLANLVYPEADAMLRMIEERPALAEKFGDHLADLAGAAYRIVSKKL